MRIESIHASPNYLSAVLCNLNLFLLDHAKRMKFSPDRGSANVIHLLLGSMSLTLLAKGDDPAVPKR